MGKVRQFRKGRKSLGEIGFHKCSAVKHLHDLRLLVYYTTIWSHSILPILPPIIYYLHFNLKIWCIFVAKLIVTCARLCLNLSGKVMESQGISKSPCICRHCRPSIHCLSLSPVLSLCARTALKEIYLLRLQPPSISGCTQGGVSFLVYTTGVRNNR